MATARTGLGLAAALNGKLYAVGGAAGSTALDTVEEYDPVSNTWATRAQMPTARTGLGLATATNGKLYAVGGNASPQTCPSIGFCGKVEEYDPATNAWTPKASMPIPRISPGLAAAPNGKLYAVGGYAVSLHG
jgi:N-acetylneuraminic acid mutarotase